MSIPPVSAELPSNRAAPPPRKQAGRQHPYSCPLLGAIDDTMDIPARTSAQRPKMSLPEIVFDSNPSDPFRSSNPSNSYYQISPSIALGPLHILTPRDAGALPALPPPRTVDVCSPSIDAGWKWGHHGESEWGSSASATTTSSSNGSSARSGSSTDTRPQLPRKDSSIPTIKSISEGSRRNTNFGVDEGYGTSISPQKSRYEELLSPSATGFQSYDSFRSSNAQAYDKSLLQKLDSRRGSLNGAAAATGTPPRVLPRSPFSSANDASPTSRIADEHRQHQLKPLSLPEMPKRKDSSDDFTRLGSASQAVPSPRNMYFQGQQYFEFRGPHEVGEPSERSLLPSIRRDGSTSCIGDDTCSTASHSHRGSYDQNIFPEIEGSPAEETSGIRRLHIVDPMTPAIDGLSPGSSVGVKRRASSPPREDCVPPSIHNVGNASELFQRRARSSRMSPHSYKGGFHSQNGSVSSTSSHRASSYASSLSLAAGSIQNLSSYGRLSPRGLSPATDLSESPFMNSSLHSPTSSVSSSRHGHQRNLSETRSLMTTRKPPDSMLLTKPQHGGPRLQGIFFCECCPKKPKKFEREEELAAHAMEKQYECLYCRNRFKNKNEAERHQNSLHLRRHSWSCAALEGPAAAFHTSPSQSSDACGFCGAEFHRSGPGVATDKDWHVRIEHLQNVHKFGECNHAKKFFRADHFRQHLKHSHAGTSGKWTNMLENACMKDEPVADGAIRGHEGNIRASASSQGGLRPVEEDE